MKTFARSVAVSLLLVMAAPAYSQSGLAVQIFVCEFVEGSGATNAKVEEMASAWLKAARQMPGGENMDAYIRYPIAEGAEGEGDFRFVMATPSFAEWGAFTDAYEGSPASKVDDEFDNLVDCGDSSMWEGLKIQ